jgi:NAD(P)-dependent dehydrogenase (short-subunit alcohol dehydrogenase family)
MYLITGASRGIGQLLFDNLSSRGEICQGTYNSSSVTDHNNFSQVDVRSFDAVSKWVSGVVDESNSDNLVLINCAGITYNAFGHKSDIDQWRNVIDVNLIGSFNLIRAVLPYMRAANYGRIINFSSVVAQKGVPGTSAYAASKSGLWGMTKALSVENAGKNITINNINLGYFDIGIIDEVPTNNIKNLVETIPVRRLGKPSNIVRTVDYIVDNADLCGVSLDVSGGLV